MRGDAADHPSEGVSVSGLLKHGFTPRPTLTPFPLVTPPLEGSGTQ